MAATKIASLVIKTLSKPIAASIKQQAHQHERFRQVCIALAQYIHRTEMTMRLNFAPRWRIFSSSAFAPSRAIRPLNDAKALEKGAQAFSEFFLFAVAALLIIAENYRGSRKRRKQRDETEEKVDVLAECVKVLVERLEE
ncbi:optic atrophy 3-like protein, partial [Tilletiaria anomala UBC 951]